MSLYARILLSCLATLCFALAAFLVISVTVGQSGIDAVIVRSWNRELEVATAVYKAGGPAALAAQMNGAHRYVTDAHGRDLVTGADRSRELAIMQAPLSFVERVRVRIFQYVRPIGVVSADRQYALIIVSSNFDDVLSQLPYYVVVTIIGATLYAFIAVGIASPLKRIADAAHRFGGGDLTARAAPLERQDEIGDLARAFNEMADRIATLVTAERRLLQDVAHELRSPLARLAFAVELVRTSPDAERSADRIRREVERLEVLLAGLLDVTADERKQLKPAREDVSVETLVREVVESCRLESEARGCRIETRMAPGLVVEGDWVLLGRAVDNVIRNAIQHSPAGATIDVDLDRSNESARIRVRDYGEGVPQELLPRIVEPFFRVDSARTVIASGGVGLGLAIVKQIIELHRGTLLIQNGTPGLDVCLTVPLSASAGVAA